MDQLWAPWRLQYVTQSKRPADTDPCFICQGLAEENDRGNLIVQRKPLTVVLLNRFPYNNGHLLIAPTAHKDALEKLSADEQLEVMQSLQEMVQILEEQLHAEGFNIGLNVGRAAGAGLPGHLHWHVVPRWHGDTNFMPILGETKVIVQSLDTLYDLLAQRLQAGKE